MCKPVAVAVSPMDGKVIVADQELNMLFIFDRKYKFVKTVGQSGEGDCEFYHIKSVSISNQGDIVVADTGNHRIQVLSNACEFVRSFGKHGRGVGEFSDMTDIEVDTQNRVYVCDSGNNRVQVLDLYGQFIREFGCCGSKIGDVDHPQGIAVCPSTGSVILADTNNKRVQVRNNMAFIISSGNVITCNNRVNSYWMGLRESHAVILRDRVVPASQVPFPGEPSGEPGQLCTEEMTAWDSFSHP